LPLRVAEAGDPLGRGRERDPLAGEAGADPERDRHVRLAGPGRAEQDDVVFGGEEVELAEVEHERLLHRALEAEVELLERFWPGSANPPIYREIREEGVAQASPRPHRNGRLGLAGKVGLMP
jgi:hypothetical protein